MGGPGCRRVRGPERSICVKSSWNPRILSRISGWIRSCRPPPVLRCSGREGCVGEDLVHPSLLTRIKIDLKRLFVTVIDHTTGPEHQLLFFKKRFLAKDHYDRAKMARFSAKLRKLGLREETIGYGPTKEKWESWNADPM